MIQAGKRFGKLKMKRKKVEGETGGVVL